VIDFRPYLETRAAERPSGVFAQLLDLDLFNQVYLDKDDDTLRWPNEADFYPRLLHDWPGIPTVASANAGKR
jgi:hypothetical protein